MIKHMFVERRLGHLLAKVKIIEIVNKCVKPETCFQKSKMAPAFFIVEGHVRGTHLVQAEASLVTSCLRDRLLIEIKIYYCNSLLYHKQKLF